MQALWALCLLPSIWHQPPSFPRTYLAKIQLLWFRICRLQKAHQVNFKGSFPFFHHPKSNPNLLLRTIFDYPSFAMNGRLLRWLKPRVNGLRWPLSRTEAQGICWFSLSRAKWVRINLPPHDLPVTILRAFEASFSNLNLTKPNPLFLLVVQSTGMKESTILPTLQNIASNSTLEISSGRLDTYKEKELYLRLKCMEGEVPTACPG